MQEQNIDSVSQDRLFSFATVNDTGEEVKLLSNGQLVSAATVMTGKLLSETGTDRMEVFSGGTAQNTTIYEGRMYLSGGTAYNTAINDGKMYVSSGTASNTILNGGKMKVSSGGTAQNITVNAGGKVSLLYGAAVSDITWTPCIGECEIDVGVSATFTSKYSGVYWGMDSILYGQSAFLHNSSIAGCAYVMQGGSASGNTILTDAVMEVWSGGQISDTVVKSGGYLSLGSGASAVGIQAEQGTGLFIGIGSGMVVNGTSNGSAFETMENDEGNCILYDYNIGNGGALCVYAGGIALGVTFSDNSGSQDDYLPQLWVLSGGSAKSVTMANNTQAFITSGGKVSGDITLNSSSYFALESGATLDFAVNKQLDPDTPLLNDWSLIQSKMDVDAFELEGLTLNDGNCANYTITVSTSSEHKTTAGTYLLAGNADGFNTSVTLKTPKDILGTLTVGSSCCYGDLRYTLTRNSGILALTVESCTPAVIDTIAGKFLWTGSAFQLKSDGTAVIRSASGITSLSGTIDPAKWTIAGAGDFNGSGKDGLLWVEKATGYVYMQYDMTSLAEVSGKVNCLGVLGYGYSLTAAGDFTGNGISGALLQGPAFGDKTVSLNYGLPVWARNDDGSTFNGWLGALVNTWQEGDRLKGNLTDPASINANNYQYAVIGVADFNGDGVDDVMLQNTMPETVTQDGTDYTITGSGDVFTFLTGDKAAIQRGDAPTVCYAGCATDGWNVFGFGDFDNDGVEDALLSDGTGLAGWKMVNGQRSGNFWFGNLAAGDEIAGIADFNNDGTDDILIRTAATENLNAWIIQNGAMTGSIAIA